MKVRNNQHGSMHETAIDLVTRLRSSNVLSRKFFAGTLCLLVFCAPSMSRFIRASVRINTGPICYFIISSEVERGERRIKLLIDEEDFTEMSLRILARTLFAEYAEPRQMAVFVDTHITQTGCCVDTEGPGKLPGAFHPSAAFYRKAENEFIRYTLPGKPLRGIVLKGEDPLQVPEESFTFTAGTTANGVTRGVFAPLCYFKVDDEEIGKKRLITVFIDEADFTEPNLSILTSHFFEKDPKIEWVEVKVLTNYTQLFDFPAVEGPARNVARLHPSALLSRKDGNENILYNLPNTKHPITVVIKGKAPLQYKQK